MDALVSRPGEMMESSGIRNLVTFPSSAAVDSNTGVSPSSSETSPQGEAKYNAILIMRNGGGENVQFGKWERLCLGAFGTYPIHVTAASLLRYVTCKGAWTSQPLTIKTLTSCVVTLQDFDGSATSRNDYMLTLWHCYNTFLNYFLYIC